MGLDDLYPFKPEEKIIEYAIADTKKKKLVDMTLEDFVHTTASEAPAPGGGSISAAMGAMGAALGTMVANLSSHKRGWDDRWEEFSDWAEKGKRYHDELLRLIDDDTDAFNKIMEAFGLPQGTEQEKAERDRVIQEATKHAIEVPFQAMKKAYESMEAIKAMAEIGNPASVSDAGVGALAARSAVMGAFLNVKINAGSLDDKAYIDDMLAKGKEIEDKAMAMEKEILDIVNSKI
jgi:glutamate formiminotransferase/formiminotetrahydrofolate cyclodeaminase